MTRPYKVYPDTVEGAVEALCEISDIFERTYTTPRNASVTPDPCLRGEWLVETHEFSAFVYLAGYRDADGKTRTRSEVKARTEGGAEYEYDSESEEVEDRGLAVARNYATVCSVNALSLALYALTQFM